MVRLDGSNAGFGQCCSKNRLKTAAGRRLSMSADQKRHSYSESPALSMTLQSPRTPLRLRIGKAAKTGPHVERSGLTRISVASLTRQRVLPYGTLQPPS